MTTLEATHITNLAPALAPFDDVAGSKAANPMLVPSKNTTLLTVLVAAVSIGASCDKKAADGSGPAKASTPKTDESAEKNDAPADEDDEPETPEAEEESAEDQPEDPEPEPAGEVVDDAPTDKAAAAEEDPAAAKDAEDEKTGDTD